MIVDVSRIKAGFCDRLRRLTFCMAVAECRGDRELVVLDETNAWCPYRILDLVDIDHFECRNWLEGDEHMEEVLYRSNSGPSIQTIWQIRPPDLRGSSIRLLRSWQNQYGRLKPTASVAQRLERLGLNDHCVGLHIRLTDKVSESDDPTLVRPADIDRLENVALTRILSVIHAHSSRVFLACDNPASRDEWVERLRSRDVVVLTGGAQFKSGSLRLTDGEDFAVDLFGLSRCSHIFGLVQSGVIQTASRIGGVPSTVVNNRSVRVMMKMLRRKTMAMFRALRF